MMSWTSQSSKKGNWRSSGQRYAERFSALLVLHHVSLLQCSVKALVDDTMQLYGSMAESGVAFVNSIDESLPSSVWADSVRVKQVI